jgi:putative GTP pyrophosphokinase
MILEKQQTMASLDMEHITEMLTCFKSPMDVEQLYLPYRAAINIVKAKLENIDNELQITANHNPIHYMASRIKSPQSILGKLKSRNLDISKESIASLTDIAGIRVICHYCKDIYTIADIFENQSAFNMLKKSDYIQNPKPNGYRSLHMIVETPVYQQSGCAYIPVEIQVRTVAMDFWASLEHQLRYKTPAAIPGQIHAQLKECADVIAQTDMDMQGIFEIIHEGANT